MAFGIILLETFALYLMIMAGIHTDILEMRLRNLGSDAVQADDKGESEIDPKEHLILRECFQVYALNLR